MKNTQDRVIRLLESISGASICLGCILRVYFAGKTRKITLPVLAARDIVAGIEALPVLGKFGIDSCETTWKYEAIFGNSNDTILKDKYSVKEKL